MSMNRSTYQDSRAEQSLMIMIHRHVLRPITSYAQQGHLPDHRTIAMPMDSLPISESPDMMDTESSYASTIDSDRSERESSMASSTASLGRQPLHPTCGRADLAPNSPSTRTSRLSKSGGRTVKAQKSKDERDYEAKVKQAIEDFLAIISESQLCKLQTKGNGRRSGLRHSKEETAAAMIHIFGSLIKDKLVPAREAGPEEYMRALQMIDAYYKEGVDHYRQNARKSVLRPDHLLADAGDEAECTLLQSDDPELVYACATHTNVDSRERSKNEVRLPDFRNCRLARRRENFERNLAREVATQRSQRATPTSSRACSRM